MAKCRVPQSSRCRRMMVGGSNSESDYGIGNRRAAVVGE
jgi:hypothetical protein